MRREVLGDEHVDRAVAATTRLSPRTSRSSSPATRGAGSGRGRARPAQTARSSRSPRWSPAGHFDELEFHLRAALRNGLTREEIVEVLLQTAVYCGVPAANSAFAVANRVLADDLSAEHAGPGVIRDGRVVRDGPGRPCRRTAQAPTLRALPSSHRGAPPMSTKNRSVAPALAAVLAVLGLVMVMGGTAYAAAKITGQEHQEQQHHRRRHQERLAQGPRPAGAGSPAPRTTTTRSPAPRRTPRR